MISDFSLHPFTYFTCGEAIADDGHLKLIFISCPYLSFLRKKFMVQGEDKLKGSAQANLEQNRQRFKHKKSPVQVSWTCLNRPGREEVKALSGAR